LPELEDFQWGGNSMLRTLCLTTTSVFLSLVSASAQVQTVGDVSFSVLSGWQYQQGPDFGAMTLKNDNRFWLVVVYSAMPSSGDPNIDFKTAWKRVVFPLPDYGRMPGYDPYNTSKMLGYSGKYYDAASTTNTSYTRLYVLETGKAFVPVSFTSTNRNVLDSMSHNERAVTGSVRVAPAKPHQSGSPSRSPISRDIGPAALSPAPITTTTLANTRATPSPPSTTDTRLPRTAPTHINSEA
jgi:hypothetical protein